MELNEKQENGLNIAVQRFKDKEPYTCISGYAGVGKTTLIQFIVGALGLKQADVAYVAYTGKAAEVLRHKGCANACTAHKLLYDTYKDKEGRFHFTPKKTLKNDFGYKFKLIVVDEVSMLPQDMWDLLLSHNIHVLASGDPFQLPPINPTNSNKVLETPHVFLDEIVRQEADSEIIQLSMKIRNGEPLDYFKGEQVQVLHPWEVVNGMYTWADQILVATNKTRKNINKTVRTMQGRSEKPEIGDKVICLSNYWDVISNNGEAALVNGTIGTLLEYEDTVIKYPVRKVPVLNVKTGGITTDFDEEFSDLIFDPKQLEQEQKLLTNEQEYALYRIKDKYMPPLQFNYGYAITCHRAQGSQWDKVLVIEESFPFADEEHRRWLYTAATRAAKKLVLIRDH